MKFKQLTAKDSKLVLDCLASISTEEERLGVLKRNTELLENQYTNTPCPHCDENFPCHSCKWTEACKMAGLKDIERSPCCFVKFGCSALCPNIENSLALYSNRAQVYNMTPAVKRYLQAHINWANDKEKWGTKLKEV